MRWAACQCTEAGMKQQRRVRSLVKGGSGSESKEERKPNDRQERGEAAVGEEARLLAQPQAR